MIDDNATGKYRYTLLRLIELKRFHLTILLMKKVESCIEFFTMKYFCML